jgi:MFS family permease
MIRTRLRVFLAVLRDPNLLRIQLAFLGFNMTEYATWVAILVYAYTRGGAAAAGAVSVILLMPAAIVAPLAAYSGDRFRRDRVLLVDYLVQAAAVAATAVALHADAQVGVVYAAAIVASVSMTFTRPAQGALLPVLTSTPEDLTAANAVSGVIEGTGILLGPLAAGILLGTWGPASVFAVFAAVTLAAAVLVSGLRVDVAEASPRERMTASDVVRETFAGFRTLRRERRPLLVVLLLASGVVVVGALDVLLVAAAIDLLGIGASGAGYLNAAFGAGGIAGAAAALGLVGRRRLSPPLAAGACLFGAPVAAMAAFPSATTAPILIALGGAGRSVADIAGRTLLQRVSPAEVLARIFGVLEGLAMIALAIGSVGAAVLVDALGIRGALVVAGALVPLVVLASARGLLAVDREAVAPDPRTLELLRRIPIFAPLPPPAMERLLATLVPVEIGAGDVLIREGDAGDRFYVIVDGRIEVTRGNRVLGELGPEDHLGEIALLRDIPRTATATALSPARLLALERAPFLEAVTGHPQSLERARAVGEARLR